MNVWVCDGSEVTWQCLASHSQDTWFHSKPKHSLFLCVCSCNESVCSTEQEAKQTDMSLTLNILQTVQPPPLHWLCDSYFPHPSGCQWKASQAAYSHTCLLERWLTPVCWSNPDCTPFSPVGFFTHCVNVHIYKQLIVLPKSSGTARGEEKQTRGAFWKSFYPQSPMAISPISC